MINTLRLNYELENISMKIMQMLNVDKWRHESIKMNFSQSLACELILADYRFRFKLVLLNRQEIPTY